MKKKIGFIGLGLMGNPMAKNVLKSGFPLYVYNRTISKTKELEKLGAIVTNSPKELASEVDIIITMVTGGKEVSDILFGESGVVQSSRKEFKVIDMSTVGKVKAIEIGEKLKTYGIEFLDAPVTGSVSRAITGELTIFVGGSEAVLTECRDVLSVMGGNIVYMGKTGSGQAIKLINNFLLATSNEAMLESMLLADGMDIPREKVAEALVNTPNIPDGIKKNLSEFIAEDFHVTFTMKNMKKDLSLAKAEMDNTNLNLPSLINIESLFSAADKDIVLSESSYRDIVKFIKNAYKKVCV